MNADLIFQAIQQHKGTFAVAGAWLLREAHIAWPFVRPSISLPFLRANGGLIGIALTLAIGRATFRRNPPSSILDTRPNLPAGASPAEAPTESLSPTKT